MIKQQINLILLMASARPVFENNKYNKYYSLRNDAIIKNNLNNSNNKRGATKLNPRLHRCFGKKPKNTCTRGRNGRKIKVSEASTVWQIIILFNFLRALASNNINASRLSDLA